MTTKRAKKTAPADEALLEAIEAEAIAAGDVEANTALDAGEAPVVAASASPSEAEAKAAHLADVYEALGVRWGDDPFPVIAQMRAAVQPAEAIGAAVMSEPAPETPHNFSLDGLTSAEQEIARLFTPIVEALCARVEAGEARDDGLVSLKAARRAVLRALRPR